MLLRSLARWTLRVVTHLENVPPGWHARYTYTFAQPDEYRELFELDPNGKGFRPYTATRFLRVGAAKTAGTAVP